MIAEATAIGRRYETAASERTAPAQPHARSHQRDAGGKHDEDRVEDELELRDAVAELELQRREADEEGAGGEDLRTRRARGTRRGVGLAARARRPSTSSIHRPSVAREPPPTISTWVGLQSVTSWPKRRCQTSSIGKVMSAMPAAEQHHGAAERHVDAREAQRRRDLAVGAEDHRQEAGEGDAGQAEEDQVVRVVGEGTGVAAVVDVDPDVPVEAEGGGHERRGADEDRQRRPAGQARSAGRETGGAVDDLSAAGAVRGGDPEHGHRRGEADERGGDQVGGRGAARGRGGGGERSDQAVECGDHADRLLVDPTDSNLLAVGYPG